VTRETALDIPAGDSLCGRKDFCFRRDEHLKRRNDIRDVFGKGKRFSCQGAKLFVLMNNLPHNRICFTISRTSKRCQAAERLSWNAVQRNREKRLGREAFRLMKPRLRGGHDLILLVYPDLRVRALRVHAPRVHAPQSPALLERSRRMEFLFAKAGLLK